MRLAKIDLPKFKRFKVNLVIFMLVTIALLSGGNSIAYASIPSDPTLSGQLRCAVSGPRGERVLVAELQIRQISINNTDIGEVLATAGPVGGQWDFFCNWVSNTGHGKRGRWQLGFHTFNTPSWSGDSSVCLPANLEPYGIGVRYFNYKGDAVPCSTGAHLESNLLAYVHDRTVMSTSYSGKSGVFAELVRVGTLLPGTYQLPGFEIYSRGWNTNSYTGGWSYFSLEYLNASFETAACFMAGHNQIVDFGERTRGTEAYSKPFHITLTDCAGQDLIDFKASADLTFASSSMNTAGTRLENCNDSDCADGAYITITEPDGDPVNFHLRYPFDSQPENIDNRLSFNANLHTENTTVGKIEASLTLIVAYR